MTRLFRHTTVLLALVSLGVVALAGCSKPPQIKKYAIEKETPSQPPAKERILAAIVPHGAQSWFFKAQGPSGQVASLRDSFTVFIKSVRFTDEAAAPEWTLSEGWRVVPPEEWKHKPGADMRHATLEAKADAAAVEVTVSSLPTPAGDAEQDRRYLLSNVNRWRGQLSLSPLDVDVLDDYLTKVDFAGGQAVLVDFEGIKSKAGMRPPMMADREREPPSRERPPVENESRPADDALQFTQPEGWQPGPLEVSRGGITVRYQASFKVEDGKQKLEITASNFPSAARSVVPNVNRWREQIGLSRLGPDELLQQLKPIQLAEVEGQYVDMTGPDTADAKHPERILGVIAPHGPQTYFIKLRGDAPLAAREKEKFDAFVRSIRFK